MTDIAPGWYRDPADPTTQRYWDGEGWIGAPLDANATPPPGPPPVPPAPAPAPAAPSLTTVGPVLAPPAGGRPRPPGAAGIPAGWPAGAPVRPHGFALASAGSRLAARVIDILSVTVLCAIANAWFGYQIWLATEPLLRETWRRVLTGEDPYREPLPQPGQNVDLLLFMMLFVIVAVWFAYEVPGTANSGQTLGKRLMRIRVVALENTDRLGFGRSWRRWSRLGMPTLLWPCCFFGAIIQVLDCVSVALDRPLRQALHDKTAATVVVQVARHSPDPRTAPGNSAPNPDALVGGRDADARKS